MYHRITYFISCILIVINNFLLLYCSVINGGPFENQSLWWRVTLLKLLKNKMKMKRRWNDHPKLSIKINVKKDCVQFFCEIGFRDFLLLCCCSLLFVVARCCSLLFFFVRCCSSFVVVVRRLSLFFFLTALSFKCFNFCYYFETKIL